VGFLSSIYLWLIPLASLPLLIHLFYNRKYRLIEFSSIKFLKDLEVDSMRKIHIIELLLLLIRTLIIFFLILMLSRPVIKSESFESYFKANQPINCLIALDDSFSMTRSDRTVYLKDIFSKKIKNIIQTLPQKSYLSIIRLSDQKLIYDGLKDDYLDERLVGKMGDSNIDFSSFINSIQNQEENINREIHILSDFQEYSFLDIQNNSLEGWNIFMHEMNYIDNNLSIISANIKNDIISLNKEIQIDVKIQNNGKENAKNALLVLNIDNLNVGQQQLDLNAGESSTYNFFTILSSPGKHIARIELIYDDFNADNIYSFDLDIPKNINIGILSDFSDDFIFLNNSLKAFNDNFKNLTIRYSNEILNNQALLMDNDITFIFGYNYIANHNLESSIIESLNNGNTVYLHPSNQEKINNIKTDFFDFISFDVLEIDFKEYNSYNSVEISSKNLINKDLINIFNTQDSSENHTYMNLYKFFNFPGNKNTNILIDGMSIWNTYSISSGSIEIIGFLPRLDWTNFPIKASFISWIDYCITYGLNNLNKTYEVGDQYDSFGVEYTMILPDLKKYNYTGNSNQLFKFLKRGNYTLQKSGIDQTIIVNPSLNELYFNRISNDKLKVLFPNIFIFNLNERIEDKIEKARIGIELWKYFLYLVIILILIEMVISNQFLRRN